MDVRDLKRRYKVRVLGREAVRLGHLRDDVIKEGHHFLIPDYGFDSRKQGRRAEREAESLNRQFDAVRDRATLLKTFGINKILVNYIVPNPHGNPKFHLMRVTTGDPAEENAGQT